MGIRAEVKTLAERINELQKSADEAESAIGAKTVEIGQENGKLEGLEQRLKALTKESEQLRIDPEYRQKIQLCAVLEKDAASLDKSMDQLAERKSASENTIDELEKRLADLTEKIAECQKLQDELSDSIKQYESGKKDDRDSVMKSLEKLHRAQSVYQVLKLRENEEKLARNKVGELKSIFDERKIRAEELEKTRADAEKLYEICRGKLDECRLELEKNTAYLLSKKLKEGEPCRSAFTHLRQRYTADRRYLCTREARSGAE